MFEHFSESARAAVVDAQAHARRLRHPFIGCEHLLMAVVSADSRAADVLRAAGLTPEAVEAATLRVMGPSSALFDREALAAIGIDLDLVREKIEASFGADALARSPRRRSRRRRRRPCDSPSGHIPFTGRAKECLELTLREARAAHSGEIGVEHIALALTTIRSGVVPEIFAAQGVSASGLHTTILHRYRRAS